MARPHGIPTRFPILPNLLGHPDAFIYKEQIVIDADTITLGLTVSIPATNKLICWDRGRPARKTRRGLNRTYKQSIFALRAHLRAGRPRSQQIT